MPTACCNVFTCNYPRQPLHWDKMKSIKILYTTLFLEGHTVKCHVHFNSLHDPMSQSTVASWILHIESFHRSNQFHFAVYWSIHAYKFLKKQFRKKFCRCQELPHRHAFDSLFKKWILLWFAYVFKVSGYFYKMTLLRNRTKPWSCT